MKHLNETGNGKIAIMLSKKEVDTKITDNEIKKQIEQEKQ